MPLMTGGSGVAIGLPRNFAEQGLLRDAGSASALPHIDGPALVVSGSCSKATNAQVAKWRESRPAFRVDPFKLHAGEPVVEQALAWAKERIATEPVLVYATSTPEEVAAVQKALGVEAAGAMIEAALAGIAQRLVDGGVRKLICAGGETAGAVVKALGIERLRVGPQIDPGRALDGRRGRCRGDRDRAEVGQLRRGRLLREGAGDARGGVMAPRRPNRSCATSSARSAPRSSTAASRTARPATSACACPTAAT